MHFTAPVLDVGTLTVAGVSLLPMATDHAAALLEAATESRETYAFTHVPSTQEEMRQYVDSALEDHRAEVAVPFVIRDDRADRIVGSSRYLDLECWTWSPTWPFGGSTPCDGAPPTVVEIGSTWLAPSAQGTRVNAAAKLLLLSQAFDTWKVLRVTLKTDARNARSRAAIERIGATFEGVRRAQSPAVDGTVRDTAYFSIVSEEWPAVQAMLTERLAG